MFKLWAKVVKEDKIVKDFVYENDDAFLINRLGLYLADICNEFDIETPVILKKHLEHMYLFNVTTFYAVDFITLPDFDKFIVERIG